MIDVHQCPRCELKFANPAELRDHFDHDHHADPATFERYRYPARSPDADTARPRVLLVANQTLQGEHVIEAVRQRVDETGARLVVLVPATHSADQSSPPSGIPTGIPRGTSADDVGLALARWRLRTTIDRLAEAGVDAEGRIGHPDPHTAVHDLLGSEEVDEILLSTLPAATSRWLAADLPGRLRRSAGVPVTVLAADRDEART